MATGDSAHNSSTTVKSEKHLECALCLERFKSPRILPCFHTFCLACLEQVVQKQIQNPATNRFSCPICRAITTIPPGGVGRFQVNFYIEAETEASSATQRVCDMCKSAQAKHKCVECNQLSCENCMRIHSSITASRDHTVLNFDTLTSGAGGSTALTKERYCLEHAEEKIRFFCTKCNSVICRDCKLTSHEGHVTTDLSKMASSARVLLRNVTQEVAGVLRPMLEEIYTEAQSHQTEMPSKRTEALTLLQQRSNDLTRAVQAYMEEATKQLNIEADTATKSINKSVQEMRFQLASLQNMFEHVDRVARVGCDADVLELPKQLGDFFGLQTTGNQTQHLTIFKDEKWRDSIEFKHVVQAEQPQPQQRQQLQQNPYGYGNMYAQQAWLNYVDPYGRQSVDQHIPGTSTSSTINLQTLTQQIGKYIGKVERTPRQAPVETVPQMDLNRLNKKERQKLQSAQKVHKPGAKVTQEITKLQQLLANWKTQFQRN